MFVVYDTGTTVSTTLAVPGTTRMTARHAVWMDDGDVLGELLCQVVVAVTILPELRGSIRRVLALRVPGIVRLSCGHGWGVDDQNRHPTARVRRRRPQDVQDAISVSYLESDSSTERCIPVSRGGVVLVSKSQTGTRKSHITLPSADGYKSAVRTVLNRQTRHL